MNLNEVQVIRARELTPGTRVFAIRGRKGQVLVGPRGGRYRVVGAKVPSEVGAVVTEVRKSSRGMEIFTDRLAPLHIPANLISHYVADVVLPA